MLVFASKQAWKLWLPLAGFGGSAGLLVAMGIPWMLVWVLVSFVVLPVFLWSWHSVRCPRCGDRWLWNEATKGKTPSLEPALSLQTCPRCGVSAAEMESR